MQSQMKKVYIASIVKNGILGGGIVVEDDKMTYKTGKVTVSDSIRNLEMKYSNIKEIISGRMLCFPTIEVICDTERFKFIVFNRRHLLKDLKQKRG